VRVLRRRSKPRAKSFRPAERYLIPAAADARRLGHRYIGTEHLLHGLLRTDPNAATHVLRRLDVQPAAVADALQCWLGDGQPTIDPTALATLGID
jgi:ATP-dependent Clp protease ATP-binding subunit ClpA